MINQRKEQVRDSVRPKHGIRKFNWADLKEEEAKMEEAGIKEEYVEGKYEKLRRLKAAGKIKEYEIDRDELWKECARYKEKEGMSHFGQEEEAGGKERIGGRVADKRKGILKKISVSKYEDSGGELLKMVERKHEGRYDVVEIFSPPRVCKKARERGMRGGWSLDWSIIDPITKKVWDLSLKANQEEVLEHVRRDRPRMLIACPPCTMFSNLQMPAGDPRTRCPLEWKRAVALVDFAVTACKLQMELGGGFLFEHLQSAAS